MASSGASAQFCPTCANLLLITDAGGNGFRFYCQTCPYVHNIKRQVEHKTIFKRKEVDDIMGGEDMWKNVQQTDATCPKCANKRAFFFQLQTRSADEPMTTFYRCTVSTCAANWKEG